MRRSLTLLIALLAGPVLADTPLPPPKEVTACSPTKTICAVSDPATNTTIVSSMASHRALWAIPGWYRWLFVSDDGESVVVGYSGMNLVPVDVTLKEQVLLFYKHGKLIRSVTLGDLYKHKSQLRRTVSHYAWANGGEFNKANQFVLTLPYGRRIAFSPKTGRTESEVKDAPNNSFKPNPFRGSV